jgi:hypothetical protein
MNFTRQIENNNKMASTIRHSLGYLPATLLKTIIEEKIYLGKNEKLPLSYSFQTCCMYLDISHFFENGAGLKKNTLHRNMMQLLTFLEYGLILYITFGL